MKSTALARWKSPLARRLIVAIVLFSSASTLLLTLLELYNRHEQELARIEGGLREIEKVHLRALSESLWATNAMTLRLQLEGLERLPHVAYTEVRDQNRVWAHAGQRPTGKTLERAYPLTYHSQGTTRRIGTLIVVADLALVRSHLIQQALGALLWNALTIFLIAGFVLFFFYRLVTRHLLGMTEQVRKLIPGDEAATLVLNRPHIRKPDEMDELVTAINRMNRNTTEALAALRDSEQRYRDLVEYAPEGIFIADLDGRYTNVNSAGCRMLGYTADEIIGKTILDLIPPEDVPRLEEDKQAFLRGDVRVSEWKLRCKDGSFLPVEVSAKILEDGRWQGFVRDVTERQHAARLVEDQMAALVLAKEQQRQLLDQSREAEARMVSLLSAMNLGILFEDTHKHVLYYNPAFRRIWLIPETVELKNKKTREILAYSANVLARPDHFSKHILEILETHEISEANEIAMADGRVVTQLSYPVHDNEGRFVGRLWIYEDVTRERQTAEQLIYLAERDSLTGLYNRHRFQDELTRLLAEAERRQSHGALLFFDLDDFKYINDNFGHRAGDAMLIRVAGEVGTLIRRNEILARLGGDEFAVLIPEASERDAIHLAERIIRAVAQIPFSFAGQNLRLTTSLGIASYPDHGTTVDDLVAHADTAMYQSKEAGKNAWRLYRADRDTSREMLRRMSWQERIANALENNLFQLHFQGVYRADTGALTHLEALVRMIDPAPEEKLIMPGHFIPVAEKTGQVIHIDRWIIREAIQHLASNPKLPAIAINVSGRSFDDPTLSQYIYETLKTQGVAPARLIVELTETAAISDLHDAQRFIEALHMSGSRVCLDDFGTGFASFAYLKYLSAEVLKIDGLFIRNLPNEHDNQIFVKAIVDVARGLHKLTIAEFVEDAETLEMLRHFGVDMVQGYHLDMPRADHPALGRTRT